jgi:hypothetical protein
MYKILFSLILIQFFGTSLMAEGTDSLLFLSDLTYRNKAEKEIFYRLNSVKEKGELLDLFLFIKPFEDSISVEATVKKFDNFIQNVKVSLNSKDENKKVNELVETIRSSFLKTESSVSNLRETIDQGKYNCYTAAALYGLIFSKLNIPYQIIENPNTVHLIVYPEDKKIDLEIKILNSRCFDFPEHFRNKWAKSMFYAKLIPYEEFEKGYSVELFEKYYFKSNTLSLHQLAGIMFCQLSIQASDDRKVQDALYYMQKSYLLDPNERNLVTLKYHIFNALGKYNYENRVDYNKLVYLTRYRNLSDVEITADFISAEYLRYITAQFIMKINYDSIEKDYHNLILNSRDTKLKSELSYIYNFHISKKIMSGEYQGKNELSYLHQAYLVKPDNKDLHSLITESLNRKLQQNRDSEAALQLLDNYNKYFEELFKNSSIARIKVHCYLDLASKKYTNGLTEEGDDLLKKSEHICKEYSLNPDVEFVEKGYVSAAKYYFNKGNKLKAKAYLLKGFEYAPSSKLIQDKLKLVQ